MNTIDNLSKVDLDELEKCKNSVVYFYNNYVRHGEQKELTDSEFDAILKHLEYLKNNPLKLRSHYKGN